MEWCPSCGDEVHYLNPITGWCKSCTNNTTPTCIVCDKPTSGTKYCSTHRRSAWLERNADNIEKHIAQGLSVTKAIQQVQQENRPVCLCCGEPIYHGTGGRHFFCNKHDKCRKARRRYKYLIYDKGMSKDAALSLVLDKAA